MLPLAGGPPAPPDGDKANMRARARSKGNRGGFVVAKWGGMGDTCGTRRRDGPGSGGLLFGG